MQARNVNPAAVADRKINHHCRRVKGRIEEQASTETGITADAHQRIDPQPEKHRRRGATGSRPNVSDAMF
jgi:hypothetical protein